VVVVGGSVVGGSVVVLATELVVLASTTGVAVSEGASVSTPGVAAATDATPGSSDAPVLAHAVVHRVATRAMTTERRTSAEYAPGTGCWRRWTGIEPAGRGSLVPTVLKTAAPTRRADTSVAEGTRQRPRRRTPRRGWLRSSAMKRLLLLVILIALGAAAAKKLQS